MYGRIIDVALFFSLSLCLSQPIEKQHSGAVEIASNQFSYQPSERRREREKKKQTDLSSQLQEKHRERERRGNNSIRLEERSQLCITTTRKDKLRQETSVDTHRRQSSTKTKIIIWSFLYSLQKQACTIHRCGIPFLPWIWQRLFVPFDKRPVHRRRIRARPVPKSHRFSIPLMEPSPSIHCWIKRLQIIHACLLLIRRR